MGPIALNLQNCNSDDVICRTPVAQSRDQLVLYVSLHHLTEMISHVYVSVHSSRP